MTNEKNMNARQFVNYLAGSKVVVNITMEERENFINRLENGVPQEVILNEIKELKTFKLKSALNEIHKILDDTNLSQDERIKDAKAKAISVLLVGEF